MSDHENSSLHPSAGINADQKPGWERTLLEKLAFASLKEQRARRRWNIFFRLLSVGMVGLVVWAFLDFRNGPTELTGRHTALVEIEGAIEDSGSASAESIVSALNRAYADAGSVGVLLRINSPGGSPVQAGIINDEITRLRKAYPEKPLHVVVTEMCASGGYYVAVAAERIYVNKASIVGSIGVLMDGFGATGLMEKLGVERRLLTAGNNKAIMDPFSPQSEEHRAYLQSMLNEIHQQFIDVVRAGRGSRLKESAETFSGLFWSGAKAVELGLVDGYGTVDSVARDQFKAKKIIDYTEREGLPERVLKKFGAAVGSGAVASVWGGTYPEVR